MEKSLTRFGLWLAAKNIALATQLQDALRKADATGAECDRAELDRGIERLAAATNLLDEYMAAQPHNGATSHDKS